MIFDFLERQGVLGMNARNARYISRFNPRSRYPLVDDKLQTKELAKQAGIPVPELYGAIRAGFEIRSFERLVEGKPDFVVKPAHGSGGAGIIVIVDRHGDSFEKASGDLIEAEDIRYHISKVLNGAFSLGGHPDQAILEYRVRFDPLFEKVTYRGVPDIRTVVFRGFPVMAMVRLPTRASDGKANLHQGAIGVGLDLRTGRTGRGVCRDRVMDTHPDTRAPIGGLQVPQWPDLLMLAARCYELTGLGYLGVDVVLDADRGPLMLELNARPGISIQLANGIGLRKRLEVIERHLGNRTTSPPPEERLAFVRDAFEAG